MRFFFLKKKQYFRYLSIFTIFTIFLTKIYEFIDKIHQKLLETPKFIESWGVINEDLLEELIFECLYSKLFNINEDINAQSIQIHEKLLVLQNIITPELLEIPNKYLIPSVLLQLQSGFYMKIV